MTTFVLFLPIAMYHVDFNECADNSTNNCTQQCVNIPYSYQCICYDGYHLQMSEDVTQCIGKYIQIRNNALLHNYVCAIIRY